MKQLLILCLWMTCAPTYAQIGNKGVPNIRNFSYEQYQAGAQNWAILQDAKGKMLFGNNYGLLEYNGKEWSLELQTSNRTVVRSIHRGKDNTIYLGAQNEFGYVKTNDAGQQQYISLLPKIPEKHRQFSDVWSILETSSGIFFHTNELTFLYQSDSVKVLETPSIGSCSKVGDSILVQDQAYNIHVLKQDGLHKLFDRQQVRYYVLKIYDDHQGGLYFVTQKYGILKYSHGQFHHDKRITNSFFENNKVQSLQKLRNDYLAIGSVGAGLLILNKNFTPVQWLNKSNGLQSNTILAIGTDQLGNLWLATETGIDYVEITTPLYKIADQYNLEGTVSSILKSDDMLYVGTNTGVFYSKWKQDENPLHPTLNFQQVKGLSGQAWNLYKIENSIYVCHHEGLFKIEGDSISQQLSYSSGVWNLRKLKGNIFLQGGYDGIHLYKLLDGELQYLWKIKDFDETSRVIELDNKGNIWMAHGYKGIYKLQISEDLQSFSDIQLYTKKEGFPSGLFINLFKVNNQILFGTEYGTYQYDDNTDSMVISPLYSRILGNQHHIRLLKENNGDIWFVKGQDMHDDLGIIEFYDNEKFEVLRSPLQHLRGKFNPGFENITILDEKTALFGTKNGIIHFDRSANRNYALPFNAHLTDIRYMGSDSVLYGQTVHSSLSPIKSEIGHIELPYTKNSLTFSFASSFYEGPKNTFYSCYLEGFDKQWHHWDTGQSKSYTNLPAGDYTFHVKAKNIYGTESKEDIYTFSILSPWYLTTSALVVYGLFCLIGITLLLKLYKAKIEQAKQREWTIQMEMMRQNKRRYNEEKLITEQELIRLRNEKLEAEVSISHSKMEVLKTEMAASIMMITQKNNMLIKVRDDLGKLVKKVNEQNKNPIEKVIRTINRDINSEQDWEQFKIHFDKVHENFLERLKKEYPDLTPKDLQLAAYLRLNLSSKEIASMMNITIRSIEGCRYRLRKHLNLNSNTNLNEFILKF
ncbi:triple tyrosine motif-containing protein [Limibacter armeniacum]|uniref:triple tyrosine motif-containing protein n=1 Tax=Limibacter armeniacum TaxID=466084 RepID=UPI002FE567FE